MNLVPSIKLLQTAKWNITTIRSGQVLGLIAAIAIAVGIIAYLSARQSGAVPNGFAKENGRIEVERIDIGAKYAGRVADIHVKEGDFVAKDSVIAQLDVSELNAQRRVVDKVNQYIGGFLYTLGVGGREGIRHTWLPVFQKNCRQEKLGSNGLCRD